MPEASDGSASVFRRCVCLLLLLLGLGLRLVYAWEVPYNISPHDLGAAAAPGEEMPGHLGYIQYLYRNRRLPDTYTYQYYHPPLFHLVGTAVYGAFSENDTNPVRAFEALQMVNMLLTFLMTLYWYKIAVRFLRKDWAITVVTAFFAFSPTLYWLGAQINNDCLMTLLMSMAAYYTMLWAEKQTAGRITAIALCLGLGALTKTSALLLAPAIGMVFLIRLSENRKRFRKYLGQFVLFGVICIPLGLGWSVLQKYRLDMPFGYIFRLSENSGQYVGNISAWKRLLWPSRTQLLSIYVDFGAPEKFANIWGQTLLTKCFDEGILKVSSAAGQMLCLGMMWLQGLAACLHAGASVLYVSRKGKPGSGLYRCFLGLAAAVPLVSYVTFAFDFPQLCTMNYRYIVIVQLFAAAAGGALAEKEKTPGWFRYLWAVCLCLSAGLSALVYGLYAI